MVIDAGKVSGALYYPYIHLPSVDWLKANLLLFPKIHRIVPEGFSPDDPDEIKEFVGRSGGDGFLEEVNLGTPLVRRAQRELKERFCADAKPRDFARKYGEIATRQNADERDPGFQIHQRKAPALMEELERLGLAWRPENPDWVDCGYFGYEVHPDVGEVVMSTLAIAAAEDRGLDIVGGEASEPIHRCLLEKDLNRLYDEWLIDGEPQRAALPGSAGKLFEFVIGIPGDFSSLTRDQIRDITDQREPIDNLMSALRREAANIERMPVGERRDEKFKEAAERIIEKWREDRNSLGNYARSFLSTDTLSDSFKEFGTQVLSATIPAHLMGDLADKMISSQSGEPSLLGALETGGVLAAGAGLVLGLVCHAENTRKKRQAIHNKSPYRYLSILKDAGVVFRSEAVSKSD